MKKKPIVGLVDTGTSNIKSVTYALYENNAKVLQISNFRKNEKIDALVVPGIGSFGYVMERLKKENLDQFILEKVNKKIPSLFICVGMQVLFSESCEFGVHKGLNIFKGKVKEINRFDNKSQKKRNIPFIGWNKIIKKKNCKILNNIKDEEFFYFTHSYYVEPEKKEIISTYADYLNFTYCSSLSKDNIFATQFHPEKSGNHGLKIYKNFLELI
jgi:glutamine amidotransferase